MQKFKFYLIASSAAIAIILATVIGFMGKVFPWQEKRGEIAEDQICKILTEGEMPAGELESTLPASEEYVFKERTGAGSGAFYSASCTISSAEEEIFISVRVHTYDGSDVEWIKYLRGAALAGSDDKDESPFEIGYKGILNETFAGALIPCLETPIRNSPGVSLSVTVLAKFNPQEEVGKSIKTTLANHVASASKFAHKKAGCEKQLALPEAD